MELIYQKMGLDLWSQYNVLLDLHEKKMEDDAVEQCYQEMQSRLLSIIDQGLIKEVDVEQEIWSQILCLLKDKEKYTRNYLLQLQKKIDKEKCKLGGKNVIWGCGTYGIQALDFMKKYGYNCIALTDNNSKLWGEKIGGVEVKEPSSILEVNENITYVVANKLHAEEIKMQLKQSGIQEQNIVFWKK